MYLIKITCRECGKKFDITERDVEFYKSKGFYPPKRCKHCREIVNNEDYTIKRLGLKRNSFIDNAKIYGMPTDIRNEHPQDDIWHSFYKYSK